MDKKVKKEVGEAIERVVEFYEKIKNKKIFNNFNLIERFFNKKEEDYFLRVLLIDKLYSTQIDIIKGKFEEIEEKVKSFEGYFKNEKLFEIYEKDKDGIFKETFEKKYGKDKNGKGAKAVSFLSKYFYFLSNYTFPIYDKYVRESLVHLRLTTISKYRLKNEEKVFFKEIEKVREPLGVSFKNLDIFLWRYGKFRNLSFTTILSSKERGEFLKKNEDLEKSLKNEKEIKDFKKNFNIEKFNEILNKEKEYILSKN